MKTAEEVIIENLKDISEHHWYFDDDDDLIVKVNELLTDYENNKIDWEATILWLMAYTKENYRRGIAEANAYSMDD